jgi:hypothetical protein
MGLVRRIARGIRRVVRGVKGVVKGVVNTAKRAIGTVANVVGGIAGRILDKLPFGNVIRGFAQQFLNSPLGFLALGPMAGVAALLAGAGSSGQLRQATHHCCRTPAYQNPVGRQNFAYSVGYHHGRILAAQYAGY